MSNSINFGWIDYSSEDRQRVLSVLHALSTPQAVDELGIGVIRDGFSDILFPGTSTVQTRAKYFLIVPYILTELEKEKNLTKDKFLRKLDVIEKSLIPILSKDGSEGVIGARSKDKLKRKPSSIYWNGLRVLGIFKYKSLSLDSYVKATLTLNKHKVDKKIAERDEEQDDVEYNGEIVGEFWRCISPENNWKDNLNIDLTNKEAEYLKSRITKSTYTTNTLFGYIIKNNLTDALEANDFCSLGEIIDLPEHIKYDYDLASDFSEFILGATIRYNCILYNYENDEVNEQWERWKNSSFVINKFKDFDIDKILKRLSVKDQRLIRFLKLWKEYFINGDLNKIDELIIKREISIKSRARCKLNNPRNFDIDSNRVRGGKLDYRFNISKRLIKDILLAAQEVSND
ncbi:MAG: DUF6361 family protein [Clostridium sp.]|nr:DUF6361 family protein [Clostridium sp.]